mmetsp:Transcript_10651/g.34250  ORF Transcript_10651/g.34250 Transcript_10651/m.34250 type:complete len:365 (-) Transcript_10651:125-1219(-)
MVHERRLDRLGLVDQSLRPHLEPSHRRREHAVLLEQLRAHRQHDGGHVFAVVKEGQGRLAQANDVLARAAVRLLEQSLRHEALRKVAIHCKDPGVAHGEELYQRRGQRGKEGAVAIGSPAVLFTPQSAGTDAVRCPAGAVGARVLVFVNRADAVPRLLGSPLPLMGGFFSSALWRERQRKALATLESYSHLPHTEVVWLNSEGQALAVPEADRDAVLHLHEALSLDLHRTILTDHGGEAYIGGLAHALAEGPGGYPGRPSHTPGCTGSLPSVPVGIPVPQGHATEGAVATGSPIDPLYAVAAGPGGLLDRRVAVRGLVSMPEYNGRVGRAVSWDARAGRYLVALDRRAGRGEEGSIKPENLEPR